VPFVCIFDVCFSVLGFFFFFFFRLETGRMSPAELYSQETFGYM